MIVVKTASDIQSMRKAGAITKAALRLIGEHVRPGVSTGELDRLAHEFLLSRRATPSFLNYGGFPNSICASLNEVVIHSIPSKSAVLKEGDLLSVDIGAYYEGFHGDCARTFMVGTVSDEARKLVEVTRQSFYEGISHARAGNRVGDISNGIEQYVRQFGFGIVRDYTGHGVGRKLHEDPQVPNFGKAGSGPRLLAGMTLAIEPMITLGADDVRVLADKWTVVTSDGSLSAHYENTILVTDGEPEILTV